MCQLVQLMVPLRNVSEISIMLNGTWKRAMPTFCIYVQHSWIYSVTRAACGTLGFDDCIISWHYLIQSRYMHNEAWTKQHPNLLSVFIGGCKHGLSCFLYCFPPFSIACVSLYFLWLHPSSFLKCSPLVNPLFSTHPSEFFIPPSLFLVCPLSLFVFFLPLQPWSIPWYSAAAHPSENVSDS